MFRVLLAFPLPVWTDTVAKLSPFTHEARRLSDGHVDDVEAMRSHEDAIDATSSSESSEITLSQHQSRSFSKVFPNALRKVDENLW